MGKPHLAILLACLLASLAPQVVAEQQLGVDITAPKDGSYTYPDFELRWSVTGQASSIEIYVDGKAAKTGLDPARGYYYLLDLENGSRKVTVRAVGPGNETAEDTIDVTVLSAPTEVAILSPDEGSITNKSFVVVTWDAEGPIKLINFWSSESKETVPLDKDSRSYTLHLRTEGRVEARVYAVDLRGTTVVKAVTFVHDSAPPSVKVISPEDMQAFDRSSVPAAWECSDNVSAIVNVEVRVDGVMLSDLAEGERYLTGLSDGEHVLALSAVDAAGNRGEEAVRFFVYVPFWARYGMIAWLLAIIGLGLVLLARAKTASR